MRGTGEETEEIDNILTKKHEIVHTFGWYIKKICKESKDRGAIPIVCSRIPGNSWKDGKTQLASEDWALWSEEAAKKENAYYINLNKIIALKYDIMGEEEVTAKYFLTDHTHTNEAGAIINAASVAEGIRTLKGCKLKKYLI